MQYKVLNAKNKTLIAYRHNYNVTAQLMDNIFGIVIPCAVLNITDQTIWILCLVFITYTDIQFKKIYIYLLLFSA